MSMLGELRASGVAGYVSSESVGDPSPIIGRMLAATDPASEVELLSGPGWAVGIRSGSDAITPIQIGDGVVLFLDPSSDALSDSERGLEVAHRLFDAVGSKGPSAFEAFSASGMCVVLRPQHLFLGVDRFGIVRMFHASIRGGAAFATTPIDVARHPDIDVKLDLQAIYDYLYATVVPAPRTIFSGVDGLLPGDVLQVRGDRSSVHAVWRPQFGGGARDAADVDELRRLMDESVADSARGCDEVGCFLSGGVDSSTVTGLLAQQRPGRVKAFSIGFEADGYDELDYARLVAKRFGVSHHEYYVTPDDIIDTIPIVTAAYGQPFGNASVIPAYHCARLAADHGVRRLLAGDGGDELFGGNERYAQQWAFGLFEKLPAPLRSMLVKTLGDNAGAFASVPLVSKVCRYVRYASIALPDRLDIYNYINQLGADHVLDDRFRHEIDEHEPAADKQHWFEEANADSDIDRLLALDFKVTLADNDLPKVTRMCEQAGMQVRYPFLSDDVVAFACRLPPSEKIYFMQLRRFFKRAMSHLLPNEVIAKRKHGFGLPFGMWVTQHQRLREFVFDTLKDVSARKLIAEPIITALMQELLIKEPRYYGPFVWTILILECWLKEHVDA